jgi:hypothetical protein
MFNCYGTILRQEGVPGLYKGLFPCLLKVAPAMAIMFCCNELLKDLINS